MKISKHTATDMRAALRLVREELGPDAVIISTTRLKRGVEVTAAIDFDADTHRLAEREVPATVQPFRPEEFAPSQPATQHEADPYTIADSLDESVEEAESTYSRVQAAVRASMQGTALAPAPSAPRRSAAAPARAAHEIDPPSQAPELTDALLADELAAPMGAV